MQGDPPPLTRPQNQVRAISPGRRLVGSIAAVPTIELDLEWKSPFSDNLVHSTSMPRTGTCHLWRSLFELQAAVKWLKRGCSPLASFPRQMSNGAPSADDAAATHSVSTRVITRHAHVTARPTTDTPSTWDAQRPPAISDALATHAHIFAFQYLLHTPASSSTAPGGGLHAEAPSLGRRSTLNVSRSRPRCLVPSLPARRPVSVRIETDEAKRKRIAEEEAAKRKEKEKDAEVNAKKAAEEKARRDEETSPSLQRRARFQSRWTPPTRLPKKRPRTRSRTKHPSASTPPSTAMASVVRAVLIYCRRRPMPSLPLYLRPWPPLALLRTSAALSTPRVF